MTDYQILIIITAVVFLIMMIIFSALAIKAHSDRTSVSGAKSTNVEEALQYGEYDAMWKYYTGTAVCSALTTLLLGFVAYKMRQN